MDFFWDKTLRSDVHRAPFASSEEWLEVRFQLMKDDCRHVLGSEDTDEDDIEYARWAQRLLKRLRNQLLVFFPSNAADREEFTLHHCDINRHHLIWIPKESYRLWLTGNVYQ